MGPPSTITVLGCLLLVLGVVHVECLSDEMKIYNELFVNTSYNANVRPVENSSAAVEVELEFDLLSIQSVDEVNQVLSFVGFVISKWEDDHLKWNPADFGGRTKIVIPASSIWIPDFAVVNSADSFYNEDFQKLFRVMVTYEGKVTWDFGGIFTVNCELDLTYYPFDSQVCWMSLENWMYDKTEVHLQNATSHIVQDKYQEHGMWEVTTTKTYYKDVYFSSFPGVAFPMIRFEIFLARRPGYYLVNIIGPGLLLILLALFGCCLPADSGEKVGLGITIILAFSVYQLIIADSTPRTSIYTPLITTWMFILMIVSTLDTLVAMMVLYQNHHLPTPPSPALRFLYFRILAPTLCMKSAVPDNADPKRVVAVSNTNTNLTDVEHSASSLKKKLDDEGEEKDALLRQVEQVNNNLKKIVDNMAETQANDDLVDQWKAMGRITDRLCLVFSIILTIIGTAVCFSLRGTFAELLVRTGH